MRKHSKELAAHGVDVKLITFDSIELAGNYAEKAKLEWPILLDPDRHLYKGYGFEPANTWALVNPIAILRYIWVILQGHLPGKPGSDFKQLGGDVVIDPEGNIQFHYASENPLDRPPISKLLKTVGLK